MMVFKKFELYLMKDFLENLDIKLNTINNNYLSDEEKEEYDIDKEEDFYGPDNANKDNSFEKDLKNFSEINIGSL